MSEQRVVNRRAHLRFRPQSPVYVELMLWRIRDSERRSRAQRVLLRDIGLGGCSFATHLRLPIRDDVEWRIEMQLAGYTACPRIVLLHGGAEDDGRHYYGGQWRMNGAELLAFQYRFEEYVRLMLLESPHIHTLYKKVSDRRDDGEFKRLDAMF
ncbi:hypothetical protein [Cohnella hongkongensis]|uniref:PilZ domain-containing protein n=1 Tax=Cohnella hongkongensis TaxID=178337 RepID=A0ABV9F9K1_9BACL